VASATPAPASAGSTAQGQILFDKDAGALTDDGRTTLMRMAGTLAADPSAQLLVMAYAQGDAEQASNARRLSLSRALAVRSFLIDQGVHSSRIEVRALGNKVTDGPPDRVDLVVQKH
jgi:outer membrane protein OmpA-like peptidoglycan-associated protein